MHLLSRTFAVALAAPATLLLGVSADQIGMALFAAANDSAAARSTCSAMEFFGARKPLCGFETGYVGLTDLLTTALTGMSPFYLWGTLAVCATLALWLAFVVLLDS
jgi:hypothetical protein